jgi:hypothetical protein
MAITSYQLYLLLTYTFIVQAQRALLPFSSLRWIIFKPCLLFFRARKPCFLFRRINEGWNVLFSWYITSVKVLDKEFCNCLPSSRPIEVNWGLYELLRLWLNSLEEVAILERLDIFIWGKDDKNDDRYRGLKNWLEEESREEFGPNRDIDDFKICRAARVLMGSIWPTRIDIF